MLILASALLFISCQSDKNDADINYDEENQLFLNEMEREDSIKNSVPIKERISAAYDDLKSIDEKKYGKTYYVSQIFSSHSEFEKIYDRIENKSSKEAKMVKKTLDSLNSIRNNSVSSLTKTETKSNEEVEKLFSSWDGSLPGLKDYVKNQMNDPDSFEHVETGWKILNDGLHIRMKYRGNNAYGSKILDEINVKTDFQGNILNEL